MKKENPVSNGVFLLKDEIDENRACLPGRYGHRRLKRMV
jgi:hypothetical protein